MPPTPYREYRLPSGRHQLSAEEVAANRRWRLIGAASEVLAERHLRGVTARQISRRAAVSNYTFYEHFDGVDDILLAAFKLAAQMLIEVVGTGCGEHSDGENARRDAVGAALSFGAQEPGLAALMRTEVAVGVPGVAAQRKLLLERLEALLNGNGRREGTEASAPRRRFAVGAVLALNVDGLEGGAPVPAMPVLELAAMLR